MPSIKQLNPLIPLVMETDVIEVIFVDMITERAYGVDGKEITGPLGEELRSIIISKKNQSNSVDMDLINRLSRTGENILEKSQNVGRIAHED